MMGLAGNVIQEHSPKKNLVFVMGNLGMSCFDPNKPLALIFLFRFATYYGSKSRIFEAAICCVESRFSVWW